MLTLFWQPGTLLLQKRLLLVVLALFAVSFSSLDGLIKFSVACVCGGYGLLVWYRLRQYKCGVNRKGLKHARDGWQLWTASHGWQQIQIAGHSVILSGLIVLYYRCPGQRFNRFLVIPATEIDSEAHRRLRVHFRFST